MFSICCTHHCFAQTTGEISGIITNQDGHPFEMVSISFKENNKQTLTDLNGKFNIKGLKPGKYTLIVWAYGVPKQSHTIEVKGTGVTETNYTITEKGSNALNEVAVKSAVKKFHKKESEYVSRLPLKNLENPQVYSIVSKELLQEQVVIDLPTALKTVAGSGVPLLLNQNRVTFISRGFSIEPKVRNGLSNFVQTSIDPVNLERLEVIKGPSSTLFGSSVVSYGGLINRVTKKAYNGLGGEVSYTGGSWDMSRLTLDFNTPVNENHTALFRVNSAVSSQNSFQDAGFTKSFAITPTFSYQITKNLSLQADVEYGQNQGTSPIRFDPFTTGIPLQKVEELGMPYKQSYASDDVIYNSISKSIFTQVNYRISDQWTSQTAINSTNSAFDGSTIRLVGTARTVLRPQVTVGKYTYKSTDVQQNFIGDFKIGTLRNRLVAGLDYYSYTTTRKTANINTTAVDFTKDIHTTNYYTTYNAASISKAAQTATYTNQNSDQKTYSAYISDVLNVTDRLLAMLSLRADHFENNGTLNVVNGTTTGVYKQTAFSPKLGLVYQLAKDKLSLFGNYMNGFTNQTGTDIDGKTFKPEQANQLEGGVKTDLWEHKLTGSISYYDIKVTDIVRANPENSDFSIQDGTQRSKGVDIEFVVNPFQGLSIIAGYAYNDSKYTKVDASLMGLRPAGSGPARLANLWLSYRFFDGIFKGLGAGAGGNYGSEAFQTNTQTAKVIIPSYTTFDASLFFEKHNYRISFKGNNLTDENYWSYRLTPQNPINFLASVTYKFK